ncbi:Fic family protein [Spirosoma aerophilum]
MLVDYQQAQQQMLAWAADREPLNRARLQTIGAALMRRTGGPLHSILGSYDSSQGAFRLASPMTAHRKLIDAQKLPAVVDKLLKQLNTDPATTKTMRQLYDLSFQVHYDLLCLQPFREGNGRVARLLMNYVQYYHDLPISLVHAVDRQAYRRAFDQPQTQSFARPFLDFMYSQLTTYLQTECKRLSQQPS